MRRPGPAPRRCRPALAGRRGAAVPRPGRRRGRAARPGTPRPGRLGRRPPPRLVRPRAGGRLPLRGVRRGAALHPAHRPLLGQLLDNLLENACKYSGPGTPIVVRTWCEPEAVVLAVEDRGFGIPAEDLPRVFEPFYRAESARRLGRAGVGWAWPSPGGSPRRTAASSPRRASRAGAAASWSACPGRRGRRLHRRPSIAPRRSPRPRPE